MNAFEDYVNLTIAKLLKKLGFNWMCESMYGLDVRYNGHSIGEDEEYELKNAGKEKEIKYVKGGQVYNFNNTNNDNFGGYSRPTLYVAQRWLREIKNIDINILVESIGGHKQYLVSIWINIEGKNADNIVLNKKFDTYKKALEAAIEKSLKIL